MFRGFFFFSLVSLFTNLLLVVPHILTFSFAPSFSCLSVSLFLLSLSIYLFSSLLHYFQDATIRLWDAEEGKLEGDLRGHINCVNAIAFNQKGCLFSGFFSLFLFRLAFDLLLLLLFFFIRNSPCFC